MNDMARIVWTGDSQSVELPEGYRFEGEQVFVRREGNRVVLETAEDAIDPDTGLTIARLRELIQEGLDSGPSEPWDLEATLLEARRRLA
jgi:virulence-associated protein VagC